MLPRWKHFDFEKRVEIAHGLAEGEPPESMAERLGMNPTSVSREIRRNRTKEADGAGECRRLSRFSFDCDSRQNRYKRIPARLMTLHNIGRSIRRSLKQESVTTILRESIRNREDGMKDSTLIIKVMRNIHPYHNLLKEIFRKRQRKGFRIDFTIKLSPLWD